MKSSREKGRNFRRVRCRLRRVRAVVCELFRGGRAAYWPAINEVALVVCQCGGLQRSPSSPRGEPSPLPICYAKLERHSPMDFA